GLGYALTLDKLIHTEGTDMCFRPLSPGMEATAAIVWKKYQVFTKAADTFLRCLKEQLPQES
ncbi:MAG: LysR family transcriptional regulator, partial [Acutalibacter sp.]